MDFQGFWLQRFREHALFLSQLLIEPNLKQTALYLYQNWDNSSKALSMLQQLNAAVAVGSAEGANSALMPPAEFQKLNAHMLKELETYLLTISGSISPEEQLIRMVVENIEHLQLAGKLLNQPSAIQLADQIQIALNQQQWDTLLQLLDQVNDLVVGRSSGDSLNDLLLQHENLEGAFEIQLIRKLVNQVRGQYNSPRAVPRYDGHYSSCNH